MGIAIRQLFRTTANTVITNNATLATLSGLTIPLAAGQSCFIEWHAVFTLGATGGFRFNIVGANGLTFTTHSGQAHVTSSASAFTSAYDVAASSLFNNAAAAALTYGLDWSAFITANAAGNLVLQAAQNTVDANSMTVLAGSVCRVYLV